MCPECDASVSVLRTVERGEVIQCGECGAELEGQFSQRGLDWATGAFFG